MPSPHLSKAFPMVPNTSDDVLFANVRTNGDAGHRFLRAHRPHDAVAVLVGGGPSIKLEIENIRAHKRNGDHIYALNGAALWLQENGIVPDGFIVLDARASNVRFIEGLDKSVVCLIASQCDPAMFEAAKDHQVVAWLPTMGGQSGYVNRHDTIFIGGGTSVGMRALRLVHVLGYRSVHLYGYDSCYAADDGHAYSQPENDDEKLESCSVNGRNFFAAPWMIRQADDFRWLSFNLMAEGMTFHTHGDGLLQEVARAMVQPSDPRLLTLCYDLGYVLPSYDIVTSLCFAEHERIERGFDGIRVLFIPGPRDGFCAHFNEPASSDVRTQMFWGIMMGLCRCLPSVKSVVWPSSRSEADNYLATAEAVFPEAYCLERPVMDYGMNETLGRLREGPLNFVRAPQWAKDQVAKWIRPKTITITLREASHIASRNADIDAWMDAYTALEQHGFNVVLIRDTEKALGAPHAEFSFDMAQRLALYEAADLNLFAQGGAATLGMFGEFKSIVFGWHREDGNFSMTAAHWEQRGVPVGSQVPNCPNFHVVWEKETSERIVAEVIEFFDGPKQFHCCYDLAKLPANWDSVAWLVQAEMDRRREAPDSALVVAFRPGPNAGFRDDGLPHSAEQRRGYLDHVVRPLLPLIGAQESDGVDGRRYSYLMRDVVKRVKAGEQVALLRADNEQRQAVREWMKYHNIADPLVITLREATHWPKRNSDVDMWVEFARGCGQSVVFVRDTEKADEPLGGFHTCPQASRNVGFRLALYEQAKCNLLGSSGPSMLLFFSSAPWLYFGAIIDPQKVDGWPAGTPEWWAENVGVKVGEQFPWARSNQRIVWTHETLGAVKAAWRHFQRMTEVKTAA